MDLLLVYILDINNNQHIFILFHSVIMIPPIFNYYYLSNGLTLGLLLIFKRVGHYNMSQA